MMTINNDIVNHLYNSSKYVSNNCLQREKAITIINAFNEHLKNIFGKYFFTLT